MTRFVAAAARPTGGVTFAGGVAFAFAFALGLTACGPAMPTGHEPIARFTVEPAYVSAGDDYRTTIALDGRGSSDPLDDPDARQPLLYRWTADDPGSRLAPDATSPAVTLTIAGTRPVRVTLTVADGDNVKDTASAEIGLTLP